ncbi:hypothetical protein [uncultured Agrococcus sp.]|uniref:hypothetical protein n=1 Tax=uncultured Agrococcus sp. TaxID=382258 RepID=UPI0025FFD091|nr:hypothetical protein [uncultured Agrococcus sp.]
MGRRNRKLLLTALLTAVTASVSGCIFLPSLAGGNAPPHEAPGETESAHDGDTPSEFEGATPAPPRGTTSPEGQREETTAPDAVDDWPEEIPKPPGEPSPYSDTAEFYLVPADRGTFEAYVEELLALPDVEERDTSDSSYDIAWLYIGDYDVFVMFHDDSDQLSVTITPRR